MDTMLTVEANIPQTKLKLISTRAAVKYAEREGGREGVQRGGVSGVYSYNCNNLAYNLKENGHLPHPPTHTHPPTPTPPWLTTYTLKH